MRSKTRGSKELTDSCYHTKTVTTELAGLERKACEACGHVSMRFVYDVFEDLAKEVDSVLIRPDRPFQTRPAN